jgi:hypothetical protein
LLWNLWVETLKTLERYEIQSYASGIPEELSREFPHAFESAETKSKQEGFTEGMKKLLTDLYPTLRSVFLSVQQGRMTRGGKDFELQIEGLLKLAGVPFHKQERQFRTDLILPSLETYNQNKTISAVASVKRTLRERWRQVAEELYSLRSPNVFLFTTDEKVTEEKVEGICRRHNIYLVVWDQVKTSKFPKEPLVLGYTEWANERLSLLRQHWR